MRQGRSWCFVVRILIRSSRESENFAVRVRERRGAAKFRKYEDGRKWGDRKPFIASVWLSCKILTHRLETDSRTYTRSLA